MPIPLLEPTFIPGFVDPPPPSKPAMFGSLPTRHHSDTDVCFAFSLTRTLVITLGPLGNPEKSLHLENLNLITSAKSQSELWGWEAVILTTIVVFQKVWKSLLPCLETCTQFLRHSLKSYGNATVFMRPLLLLQPTGLTPETSQSMYSHLSCSTYFTLQFICPLACFPDGTLSHYVLVIFAASGGLLIKDCGARKMNVIC